MSSEHRVHPRTLAAAVAVALLLCAAPVARADDPADVSLDFFTDKLNGMVASKIDAMKAQLAANPNDPDLKQKQAELESLKTRLDDEKIVRAWWNALKNSRDAINDLAKEAELGYTGDSAINIGFFSAKNIKGLASWENAKGAWNSSEKYIAALDGLSSDLNAIDTSNLSPATKKLAGSMTALTRVMSTFGDKVPLIGDFIAIYGNVGNDVMKAAMALDKKIEAAEGGQVELAGMHGDRKLMSEKLSKLGLDNASRIHGLRDLYTSGKGPLLWDSKAGDWIVVHDQEPGVTVDELVERYLYYAKKGNKSPSPEQLLRGYRKTVVLTLTPSKTNIMPGETIDLTVGGSLLRDESKVPHLEVEVKLAGSSAFGSKGSFGSTGPIKIGDSVKWTAPDNVNEYFDFTADLAKSVTEGDTARSSGPAKARVRTGAGTKIELVARPDTVAFGGEVTLTARVSSADGQPLDAKASGMLEFEVTGKPGDREGYFGNYQDLSDQKGATRVWSAPEVAGSYQITVKYAGATSGVLFPSNTAGSQATATVTVKPPEFSVTVDEAVKEAKKDAPAVFAVTVKNQEPADAPSGELRFNLRARWAPASQSRYWRKSASEKVFWLKPGAEKRIEVQMAPTDEDKATTYKGKLWVVPRGSTDNKHAKSVILTAVHEKTEQGMKVSVTSSAKDGKAKARGSAKLEVVAKPGDTIALEFRPWGKRRIYCTKDVVEKNRRMKQVILHSHTPDGCDFGTADGRLHTSWKVTEEKVTWSGPGVKAGSPSYRATFTVPAEPGNYQVSASGTVKWAQVSKRPGGTVKNNESESGSASFTIKVEPAK